MGRDDLGVAHIARIARIARIAPQLIFAVVRTEVAPALMAT
jgi:hypothetical protein